MCKSTFVYVPKESAAVCALNTRYDLPVLHHHTTKASSRVNVAIRIHYMKCPGGGPVPVAFAVRKEPLAR